MTKMFFEKISARGSSSGAQGLIRAPHHALKMQRDSIPLPAGSIHPARAPFERSEPLQSALDCLAVVFAFLFISVTGIGIAAALFILFFVSL